MGGGGGRAGSPGSSGGGARRGVGGGLGASTGPCTGIVCISIPWSLRSRYPSIGSIPKLKSSIENLSPCLMDCLMFFIHLPWILFTTITDKLSLYRFLYLSITSVHRPFFLSTW